MRVNSKRGTFAGLLILLLALLVVSGAHGQDDVAAQVLKRINRARADANLPALTRNPQLDAAAQAHANDLLQNGSRIGHTGSNGSSIKQRVAGAGFAGGAVGENWAGYRSVDKIMEFWLNDAPHRRNIMNRRYSEIGIGVATRPNGGLVVVTDFGGDKEDAAPVQVQPAAAAPKKARPTQVPTKPKPKPTAVPLTRKPTSKPTREPTPLPKLLPTKAPPVVQVAIANRPLKPPVTQPPSASGNAARLVLHGAADSMLGVAKSHGDPVRMTLGGTLSLAGVFLLGVAVVGQRRRHRPRY